MLGVGATVSLGNWQLSRAVYKDDLQARIDAQHALPPLGDGAMLSDAVLHRQVRLSGRWLPADTIFLDNRPMNGHAGFFVLTPLQLEKGGVVLVQRGWAPRNLADRTALPPVETPAGRVNVEGRLAPPPSRYLEFAGAPQGTIRQNLDLDAYRVQTRLPLPPVVVLQTGVASDGLLRDWPEAASGSGKNRGYAFQWFGLAALITVLYVWFQIVRRFYPPIRTR